MKHEPNDQGQANTSGGFDPGAHGFVRLRDFRTPGDFVVYEYRNHRCVDGHHDFYRLNCYLSQDGEFVTVWTGLLEDVMVEAMFLDHGVPPMNYTESIFRGYIETDEQARHILRALRLGQGFPQILRADPSHGIVCELLT